MSDTRMDKTLANLVEEMDNVTTYATTRDGIRKILDALLEADAGVFDEITDVLDRVQGDAGAHKRWLLIEID